jgi:hypothetical protein
LESLGRRPVKTGMSGGGTDRSPLRSMPKRRGARPAASLFVPSSRGFQPPSRWGGDGEAARPSSPGRRLACQCQPLASDRIEDQPDRAAHHSHRNTPVVSSSSTGSASHRLGTADRGPIAPIPPVPGLGRLVSGGRAFGKITAGAVLAGAVVGGLVGIGAVVGGLAGRGAEVGGSVAVTDVVGGPVAVTGVVEGPVAVTGVGGGLVVTAPVVGGAVEAGGATVVGGAVTLTATVVGGPVVSGCPVTVVSASAP